MVWTIGVPAFGFGRLFGQKYLTHVGNFVKQDL
jgi:hypothetical protein